tara:strand:- start:418 stop:621 length:204 start_codon:yes stop_codon:yes gene_type:complete
MTIRKNNLKSIINLVVVFIFALVGFIKVKHPISYFVGVPVCCWVVYLLSNAMFTDLLFGEKHGAKDE